MASPVVMALMHLAALVLVTLDFLLWLLTLGPVWMLLKQMKVPSVWAKVVSLADINGELDPSAVWRCTAAVEAGALSTTPYPGEVATLWQLVERSYRAYASRAAQGIRPLLRMQKDEGFRFPAKVFGETQYRTYAELGEMAKAFGSGLRALGMEPQPDGDFDALEGKFKILMYEDTCADWMACAQGAFSQAMVVATCYTNLGADAVEHAVNEGKVTALVCNRKSVEGLLKKVKEMPSLEAVIYLDNACTPEECEKKPAEGVETSVKVLSLKEVLDMGREKAVPPSHPKPESVAVLMYTSGSTGPPKGVVVRHNQLLAAVAACNMQFGDLIRSDDMYIGYLPLAHILELTAETYFYGFGNCVGYADPKTLMSGPERCYPTGGLEEFRPTLMAGVPKVWETIKKGAEAKLGKASEAAAFLFKVALRMKKAAVKSHRYTPLFDLLVFKKFRNMIGGRMKFTLSGGGAISADVQEWVRTAFGCPLVQGYGLTEVCGAATIQHPFDPALGVAGSPLSSVEFTLHSEPEITDNNGKPYLSTDKEHADGSPCEGRGEVWMRGHSVTSGYFKLPDKTAEDFDKDGWFHTGDIGMLTPAGQLLIVDRKKNLVKLKGGEYVALEMMNVTYNNASIVNADAGGVCSFADASLDKPVALVQCKPKELAELAAEAGVTGKEGEELCRDPKVMAAVKAQLDAFAKEVKLPALMHAAAVMPVVDPWTTDNGCLTATNKIVAKTVWKKHEKDLEVLKPMARR